MSTKRSKRSKRSKQRSRRSRSRGLNKKVMARLQTIAAEEAAAEEAAAEKAAAKKAAAKKAAAKKAAAEIDLIEYSATYPKEVYDESNRTFQTKKVIQPFLRTEHDTSFNSWGNSRQVFGEWVNEVDEEPRIFTFLNREGKWFELKTTPDNRFNVQFQQKDYRVYPHMLNTELTTAIHTHLLTQ